MLFKLEENIPKRPHLKLSSIFTRAPPHKLLQDPPTKAETMVWCGCLFLSHEKEVMQQPMHQSCMDKNNHMNWQQSQALSMPYFVLPLEVKHINTTVRRGAHAVQISVNVSTSNLAVRPLFSRATQNQVSPLLHIHPTWDNVMIVLGSHLLNKSFLCAMPTTLCCKSGMLFLTVMRFTFPRVFSKKKKVFKFLNFALQFVASQNHDRCPAVLFKAQRFKLCVV